MFRLFGRKSKSPHELLPDVRRGVARVQESMRVTNLSIVPPLLTVGFSLAGLDAVDKVLGAQIEEEGARVGSLASNILDVALPPMTQERLNSIVDALGHVATALVEQGNSNEAVGTAMTGVAVEIAKVIDKDNLLVIGILKQEQKRWRSELKREKLRQPAIGERCTEAAVDILLQAENEGFTLDIEKDGTFVLQKQNIGIFRLRSNSEVEQFGLDHKRRKEKEEASRSPIQKLIDQGCQHVQSQRLKDAISSFSAALRIDPDSAKAYYHRGTAWMNNYNRSKEIGDLEKAIDDYSRAIEIDPQYGDAYFQRAGLWRTKHRISNAVADYTKCIETGHKVAHSYWSRGKLQESSGRAGKEKAIADFDAAVRVGDKYERCMALMSRGETHLELGNLDLSVADFTAAEAYYPKSPPGLYERRAAALRRLGRVREAIADLDQALAAMSPLAGKQFIANVYDQRGQCRKQLGESDLARQDFAHAAQLRQQTP
jgi:tetratricopeptide (TPR) repeat protein